ncbi:MAG: adenosylcobinamide-GDP ribazoletransferase [Anaerovoracaceae bacterium]
MKQITGFFMAWGCFCTIPCPSKKWNEESRNWMLFMLPFVGVLIGGINGIVLGIGTKVEIPSMIMAAVITSIPFLLSGFIHLDGYMDCNDGILSRKPLEDRQRILKDSRVGAFAVIMAILLFLFMFAGSYEIIQKINYQRIIVLGSIPYITRFIAILEVFFSRPMGTSQYAKSFLDGEKRTCAIASLVVHTMVILVAVVSMSIAGFGYKMVLTYGVVIIGQVIAASYAKKQLGGMNGDVSGYSISYGELIGVLYLAII